MSQRNPGSIRRSSAYLSSLAFPPCSPGPSKIWRLPIMCPSANRTISAPVTATVIFLPTEEP